MQCGHMQMATDMHICHTLVMHYKNPNTSSHVCFFCIYVAVLLRYISVLVATKQGSNLCAPPLFPLSLPSRLPSREGERATARKGRRETVGGGGGGHSIGTPRHSEGNHPKYFPLCAVRALRLLLHAHTHTHTVWESAKREYTHAGRKCCSCITQVTRTHM